MTNVAALFSEERLDELISEAIVDCYGRLEEAAGLAGVIERKVRVPFRRTMATSR